MNTINRLDNLLAERGLSIYALTKLTGISGATFSNARKRDGQLSVDTIEQICEALDIPLYEFFMEESN